MSAQIPPLPVDLLKQIPTADGPGINADEADSMMQSLSMHRNKLARDMMKMLERIKDESSVDDSAPVLTNRTVLIHLANLVTGRWGMNAGIGGSTKRSKSKGQSTKFIDRMVMLHSALSFLIDEVNASKPYSPKKGGGRGRNPWLRGIDGGKPGGLIICLKAVEFILTEGVQRRTIFRSGLPFGLKWGILAKGNGKLPFLAYSELPMATCPGAGSCAIYENEAGWCYSFKAWRYPDAFARQFLNTLANVADEAFSRMRAGQELARINPPKKAKRPTPQSKKWDRLLPPGRQMWQSYIKWLVLYQSRTMRKRTAANPQGVAFFRLFVDGDISSANQLMAWMEETKAMDAGRPATQVYRPKSIKGTLGHIEVYGYSKAWAEFKAVSKRKPVSWWPRNYTLNLSGGSRWMGENAQRATAIEKDMWKLPITRGYFVAVNLHGAMQDFMGKFKGHILTDRVTDQQAIDRIQTFAAINSFDTTKDVWEKANQLAAKLGIQTIDSKSKKRGDPQDVMGARAALFKNWIDHLASDPEVLKAAAIDIVADRKGAKFRTMSQAARLAAAREIPANSKAMRDKIIAQHLHEVLWAYGAGGSCPLVCGNCFDAPDPESDPHAVHRCASKPGRMFGRTTDGNIGATIHIGLH